MEGGTNGPNKNTISQNWPQYTDSKFSQHHLSPKAKKMRTSSNFLTSVNFIKMCFGLGFISQSKGVEQAGFYGAAIGATYVLLVNIFSVYLIVKARNRFKRDENIIDICDLGARLYGEGTRGIFIATLFTCNALFLMCYAVFFGTQTDQLVCLTWAVRDCGHAWEYSAIIVVCLLPILF